MFMDGIIDEIPNPAPSLKVSDVPQTLRIEPLPHAVTRKPMTESHYAASAKNSLDNLRLFVDGMRQRKQLTEAAWDEILTRVEEIGELLK